MKIVRLSAENIKKLKVVDITPTKDFIQITGKNGSGKSSILDSIWWALAGKDAVQEQPIRKGEEKAVIKVDLGEMIVTRRFTAAGTTLTVENAAGFKAPSPQAMLASIIGSLTFDPLEFSRMPEKQQFTALQKIADVHIDFDAEKKRHEVDMQKRRDINRDIKTLQGELAGINVSDNAPDEAVSVTELMKELQETENRNEMRRDLEDKQQRHKTSITNCAQKISDLKRALEAEEKELIRLQGYVIEEINYESTDPVKAKIAGAETLNKAYAAKARKKELSAKIEALGKSSDDLTVKMEAHSDEIKDIIRKAKMPIPGLSLANDMVIYNDIPFSQLSSAEQLRISIGIAMAANPKLRIIRIKDGSLLDDEGLKLVQQMAADKDYQVWVEKVSATGKVGIYMEDGEVAADNYEEENAKITSKEKKG